MVFSLPTFPEGIQSPTMAYTQTGGPSRPMSARLGGFDAGLGSDGFELGFNGNDLMLDDYG